MFSALLALTLGQGINTAPSRLDRLRLLATAEIRPANVVVLDCRVADAGLTDCRAEDASLDADRMARALSMAAALTVPQALADSGDGRVRVKMNLAP